MPKGLATDIDPLSLERQVCFALAVTNRAVLAIYRPLLEPLGLTHPQYLVMLALWDNAKSDGEPLSVKDIAALLQMDSATLSPMLKRLQTQGLVTRSRSESRRTHHPRRTHPDGPQSTQAGAQGSPGGGCATRRRTRRARGSA